MEPGLRLTERYRLLERLDHGGTVHTWRAWDEALNRPVAVRIPGPGRRHGRTGNERRGTPHSRVVDRVTNAVRTTHPAFVTVYDCDRTRDRDGRPVSYVVTAFLEGETLAERVARAPLPQPVALECCEQVAAALAAAHAVGVAHGDLRPEKVFLTPEGVRIVGLGMAPSGPSGPSGPDRDKAFTAARDADIRALGDLLGACLLEDASADGVPKEVVRLGTRCRSGDPGERPSASEAAEILADALSRRPSGTVAVPAFTAPPAPASGDPDPHAPTVVLDHGDGPPDRQDTDDAADGEMHGEADRDTGRRTNDGNETNTGREPITEIGPSERPWRARPSGAEGERKALFRVAVTVTLVAASLAAVLAITGRGSLLGPSAGQGSAPPLPVSSSPRQAEPTADSTALPTSEPAPAPSSSPTDPVPAVLATLGRLQPIVDRGQATGAIRPDVALDLDNLITNLRNDIASGRTEDAPLKLAQLREKIQTRLRERALDDEVAARMTAVLSSTAAP